MFDARLVGFLSLIVLCLPGCAMFGSKEADERLENELSTLMLDQQILETRLSLAEDRIISVQGQLKEMQEKEFNAGKKDSTKAEAKKDQSKQASQPASAQNEVQTAYKVALDTFYSKKYKESEALFKQFMKKYPDSSLMPNAGYWLGECYYGQKRYDEAILSFQSVVGAYPKHHKAADSLLKTGYSYERLGDKENARFYLQQFMEKYPKSESAPLARAALSRLG